MKNIELFRGTGVAIITPFNKNKIDFEALGKIIDYTIDGGVDYIVSLGTTGEAVTLSSIECRSVIDFTIKQVDKRVPIVAGMFGSNNTAALLNKLRTFNFDGIDAILSSSPSYSKPTQEGIYQHYIQVAKVSPVPIIIYNVPSRTGSNVTADTILRLANDSDNFIGVKEASGDLVQGSNIIRKRPNDFLVLSGDDPTAMALCASGGDGSISVIANAYPQEWSEMIKAAVNENNKLAQVIHNQLLPTHHYLYKEGNPTGIKAALEILGYCNRSVRLPLVQLTERTHLQLKKEMHSVQQRKFSA